MHGASVEPFCADIAGLRIRVSGAHEGTRNLCRDYLAPANANEGACDLHIALSTCDIDRERELSTDERAWTDDYLETLALLRKIAEAAPRFDRMLFHGAVVAWEGRGFLFTAPSGTGKSTHVRLWRRYLGSEARVINGDKPLLHVPEVGAPLAFGTPWAGKEGWQENAQVPLSAICFLSRSEPGQSRIRRISPACALTRALQQVYLPKDAASAARTLELLDRVLRVELFELACDMSEDAVRASFEGLSGSRMPNRCEGGRDAH